MATEKRLIDANKVINEMQKCIDESPYERNSIFCYAFGAIIEYLKQEPTVDAVEVVHGQWIEKVDMVASYLADCEETFFECSVCNSPSYGESPYCPTCGAKMDGDGNA